MLTVPALQMPEEHREDLEDLNYQWEEDMYIPSFWILGPDMSIIATDADYPSNPSDYL